MGVRRTRTARKIAGIFAHPRLAGGLLLILPLTTQAAFDDLLALPLEELGNVKVSSPTLTPETINRAPAAISVFTRDEIRRLGYDYLHELLDLVPGLQVTRSADGPFNVSARGRANSTSAPEILVLLDGVPRNDPRGGGAGHLLERLPLEWVERVEVIRGPGSALYGENAFTGVINIITRQGVNEIGALAGSFDRINLHGLGHTTAGDWHLNGFLRGEQDNGDNFNVPESFGTGRIDTGDPMRDLNFAASASNQSTRVSVNFTRQQRYDYYFAESVSNEYNDFTSDYVSAHLEQQLPLHPALDSRLLLGWQQLEWDYWLQGTGPGALAAISTPSSNEPMIANGRTRSSVRELYWKNNWAPSDQYSVQFGADWRDESDDQSELHANYDLAALFNGRFPVAYAPGSNIVTSFSSGEDRQVTGAYLQYQQQLADPTRLTLSIRHDRYSDADSRTSPRLGLVHQLDTTHSLKLLYAEAFRAPTLYERNLRNNSRMLGNPGLQHEIVKTWDLIWLHDADNHQLNVGWFHNHYIDPIQRISVGNTRTFVTGDDESSQGFELSARWMPIRPLRLGASLTRFTHLPDAAFRDADTLGTLQLNYSQARWSFDLAAVYHGERAMLDPASTDLLTLDPYWLLNAKLLFDPGNNLQWWLQAKNLLDDQYESPGEGNRLREGMPNRGLELALGGLWQY